MFFTKQYQDQLQSLQELVLAMRDDVMRLERKLKILEEEKANAAPYGYTLNGTPKKKPGRKAGF